MKTKGTFVECIVTGPYRAQDRAAEWRELRDEHGRPYSVRVFQRTVSADGHSEAVGVVIVRKKVTR